MLESIVKIQTNNKNLCLCLLKYKPTNKNYRLYLLNYIIILSIIINETQFMLRLAQYFPCNASHMSLVQLFVFSNDGDVCISIRLGMYSCRKQNFSWPLIYTWDDPTFSRICCIASSKVMSPNFQLRRWRCSYVGLNLRLEDFQCLWDF